MENQEIDYKTIKANKLQIETEIGEVKTYIYRYKELTDEAREQIESKRYYLVELLNSNRKSKKVKNHVINIINHMEKVLKEIETEMIKEYNLKK